MSAPQNVIALVFDFDDTLTDDSTTALLESVGIDTEDFWKVKARALLDEGWDPTPAYLKLLLDNVGKGKPFGKLTNAQLKSFGKGLKFYPGLPQIFDDLKKAVAKHEMSRPAIEFYIISGGLEQVIRGSSIAKYMSGIWGCEFAEENGQVRHIKKIVSFTEKTKYLFQINKGIGDHEGAYEVNKFVAQNARRVPFSNMIYLGDGLTDVPCFSLLANSGGRTFGVFKASSPKKAWEGLVAPKRVHSMNAPKYRKTDDLGSLLRMAVEQTCNDLDLRTHAAVKP